MCIIDENKSIFECCSKTQTKIFKKGDIITNYTQNQNQICTLIFGKADLIRYDQNGSKNIIESYNVGDIFGNALNPVNKVDELFVESTEDSKIVSFIYDDVKLKCKTNCKYHYYFINELMDSILKNSVRQSMRIEILTKRTIKEKLISYFTFLSEERKSKTICIPFSLTDLADYLSVDRSAMMREIKKLIDDKMIIKNGNKIKILY